jgi:hypothetical protein
MCPKRSLLNNIQAVLKALNPYIPSCRQVTARIASVIFPAI